MASPYTDEDRAAARRLKAEGLSNRKIADKLMIGRRTIDNWLSSEQPAAPQPPAAEADEIGGAADGPGHQAAGEQPPTTRAHERAPRRPSGARIQTKPIASDNELDFVAIGSYIEGAYRLGSKVALERGDPILSSVIHEHAGAASKAWIRYIQSEPKVAELLRKLMVGTPLGEVIAIHVSIVFSYTLARSAAAALADEAERRTDAADPVPA